MTKEPLVSIIIPVYNGAENLRRSLDSAIGQTLRNIEIICVDDGSTDETPSLLREYAERDSRVRVITQPENGGTLRARSAAIDAARGEYTLLLDSDDSLNPRACEVCSEQIAEADVDLLWFSYSLDKIDENGNVLRTQKIDPILDGTLRDKDSIFQLIYSKSLGDSQMTSFLFCRIYKTALLQKAHSKMEDFYCVFGEDLYECFFILYYAESIKGMVTEPFYTYCFGQGISGTSRISPEKFEQICQMRLLADRIESFLKAENAWDKYGKYQERLRQRMISDCCIYGAKRMKPEDYGPAAELLTSYWFASKEDKRLLTAFLDLLHEYIYWAAELETARGWDSQQLAFRDARITELQAWIAELEKAKAYGEEQIQSRDARIEELQTWIAELEKAKAYGEEQIQSRDARIEELQSWTTELEKAKAYCEDQMRTKDARIAELQSWTTELEKAKAYCEGQIQAKDARIAELEGWTSELESAKAYIEELSLKKDAQIEEYREKNQKKNEVIAQQEEEICKLRQALRNEIEKPWHQRLLHGSKLSDYGL